MNTSRLGLAKPFWGLPKAFWVASLIVHTELYNSGYLPSSAGLICLPSLLCLNVQGWDKQTTLGIFGATVFLPPPILKPLENSTTKLKGQEVTRFTRELLHPVDNYSS